MSRYQSPAMPIMAYYIPIGAFVLLFMAEHYFADCFPGLTTSETGLVESLQAALLFGCLIQISLIIWRHHEQLNAFLRFWLALGFVCTLYVLLEEISYGQHYLNWSTPEYWTAYNDQRETNLHNTSSWLDQKPRTLLEIGVIFAGIVVPLLHRFRPHWVPSGPILDRIIPTGALFVTAIIAELATFHDEMIVEGLGYANLRLFERDSEFQELYFYYFVLLYFMLMAMDFRQLRKEGRIPPESST